MAAEKKKQDYKAGRGVGVCFTWMCSLNFPYTIGRKNM